ncbi:Uncharacterised protein [Citrobacter koseri]|jgi:hypothetical protein|nr:Uncharacterised protein [Citrobacter koseri]
MAAFFREYRVNGLADTSIPAGDYFNDTGF